jgi:hypothetical protein
MQTTYILKSQRGSPLLSFDNINRAKDVQRDRRRKGIKLRLFRVTQIEEELQ